MSEAAMPQSLPASGAKHSLPPARWLANISDDEPEKASRETCHPTVMALSEPEASA
jgi:hypothetical protein